MKSVTVVLKTGRRLRQLGQLKLEHYDVGARVTLSEAEAMGLVADGVAGLVNPLEDLDRSSAPAKPKPVSAVDRTKPRGRTFSDPADAPKDEAPVELVRVRNVSRDAGRAVRGPSGGMVHVAPRGEVDVEAAVADSLLLTGDFELADPPPPMEVEELIATIESAGPEGKAKLAGYLKSIMKGA